MDSGPHRLAMPGQCGNVGMCPDCRPGFTEHSMDNRMFIVLKYLSMGVFRHSMYRCLDPAAAGWFRKDQT